MGEKHGFPEPILLTAIDSANVTMMTNAALFKRQLQLTMGSRFSCVIRTGDKWGSRGNPDPEKRKGGGCVLLFISDFSSSPSSIDTSHHFVCC